MKDDVSNDVKIDTAGISPVLEVSNGFIYLTMYSYEVASVSRMTRYKSYNTY